MKDWLFVGILLLIAFSCEKQEIQEYYNQKLSFSFSECKNMKSAELYDDELVEYKYISGDSLMLVLRNVYFNCCQEEGSLMVDFELCGDSLIFNEYEKEPGVCDCICPYDMESIVGPIQKKEYRLIIQIGGQEKFSFLIDFKNGLEGVKRL